MPLPNQGDLNWAPPLNDYILNTVGAEADSAKSLIVTHESTSDAHGDRAFASGLITGITANYGMPNGVAQLGGDGRLKSTQAPPGGGVTNFYDVILDFGAVGNGTHDDAPAINAALTAAAGAGGGEVWIPDGNFAIGSSLVIGASTWLNLSPGAKISRIANPTPPATMLANYTPSTLPAAGNIHVSGGQWDALNGSITQACNVFSFFDAGFCLFEQTKITGPENSTGILLAGCSAMVVDKIQFAGVVPTHARSFNANTACIRMEPSNSSVVSGLLPGTYTGLGCNLIAVTHCIQVASTASDVSGPYTKYNYMLATYVSGVTHSNIEFNFNYGNAFANNALNPSTWATVTVIGNQFTNSGTSVNITGISDLQATSNSPGTGAVTSGWTPLTLLNGWAPVAGEMKPSYRVSPTGDTEIAGTASGGSANNNTIIATLPAGFFNTSAGCRLVASQTGTVSVGFGGATMSWPYIEIDTSGNIRLRNFQSSPGQISFAGTVYKTITSG